MMSGKRSLNNLAYYYRISDIIDALKQMKAVLEKARCVATHKLSFVDAVTIIINE